jgi:4-amino-4-deoxy-L-arabinose transferase-like glycosyltransferase
VSDLVIPEARPSRVGRVALLALLGLFAVALGLRVWGIDSGRPYAYPADEWVVLNPAVDMVRTGDWNPHQFLYPSALIYAERAVVTVIHAIRDTPLETAIPTGLAGLPQRSETDVPIAQFRYLLGGRLLVAMLGALTVLLVFAAARRLTSTTGALGAGLFVAIAPLHVIHSHVLTTDVPTATMTALTLMLALVGRDRGWRWLVAAGVAAGVAASTKYNGGLVLVVPLLIHLCTLRHLRDLFTMRFVGVILLIIVGSMVGFAAATPAVIFDTGSVLAAIQLQATIYSSSAAGAEGDSARYYLEQLYATGLGPTLAFLVIGGILAAARRHGSGDIAVLLFTVGYLAVISAPLVHFDRNLLPVLPFLAVLGGFGVEGAVSLARTIAGILRRSWLRRPMTAVTVVVLALAFWQPLAYDVSYVQYLQLPDTRTMALEWIQKNIPRGTAMIREDYTPKVPAPEYRVGYVWLLYGHSLDWYRDTGARYLIASSSQFGRFTGYPDQTAFYTDLLSRNVVYETDSSAEARGPRIVIVDLAPAMTEPSHPAPTSEPSPTS